MSATSLIFLGEVGHSRSDAIAVTRFSALSFSALNLFLAPIIYE
ncbi:hypothetical protein [uncultured Rikenella sp.]|nr:hypothetical protein [uncultured Rikenella sp.]